MWRFTLFTVIAISITQSLQVKFDLPSAYIFEEQLNETLIKLSTSLSEHDPLSIPLVEFKTENEPLNANAHFEDVVLIGFSKFTATNLKVNLIPPSVLIEINFPKIQVVSPVYDFNVNFAFIPLYGKGSLSLLVKDMSVGGTATAQIGGVGGVSGIKDLKVFFNVTQSALHMSGLFNNEAMSQIVSTSTTECFPKFIQNYNARLGEYASSALEAIINDALQGKSIKIPREGSIKEYSTNDGTFRCQF